MGVDLLTLAGHKLYAPKGIGALYIRQGLQLERLIHGAGHEHGRRAGTENIAFDVALGQACEIARAQAENPIVRELTDYFWSELKSVLKDQILLNGHPEHRLPNTLNVSFVGHQGHPFLEQLPDLAVSTGSACHSGETALSPVLKAMGVPDDLARGAVRLSLGRFTHKTEVNLAVNQILKALAEA